MTGRPLTFVIPVRHPSNARDWTLLKANLAETVRSIANQDTRHWQAVIVANRGSDLPPLPPKFTVVFVDFPPNPMHELTNETREVVYQAFRMDKGRRVLAGLVAQRPEGHVMIVDDDDFVSRRLSSFVAANSDVPGWFIESGYVWGHGGYLLYKVDNFSKLCGTSHIIRADLYEVPDTFESASSEYIARKLGSHIFIEDDLAQGGIPLSALPFCGAIYRVGHPGAHSKSTGILTKYLPRALLKHPVEYLRRAARLRPLSGAMRREFFG